MSRKHIEVFDTVDCGKSKLHKLQPLRTFESCKRRSSVRHSCIYYLEGSKFRFASSFAVEWTDVRTVLILRERIFSPIISRISHFAKFSFGPISCFPTVKLCRINPGSRWATVLSNMYRLSATRCESNGFTAWRKKGNWVAMKNLFALCLSRNSGIGWRSFRYAGFAERALSFLVYEPTFRENVRSFFLALNYTTEAASQIDKRVNWFAWKCVFQFSFV